MAALEASGPEARELLSEQWFLHELSKLKVGGDPIYKAETRLRARPATEDEWAIYDHECNTADDADEVLFVYLVSTWIASGRHRLLGHVPRNGPTINTPHRRITPRKRPIDRTLGLGLHRNSSGLGPEDIPKILDTDRACAGASN